MGFRSRFSISLQDSLRVRQPADQAAQPKNERDGYQGHQAELEQRVQHQAHSNQGSKRNDRLVDQVSSVSVAREESCQRSLSVQVTPEKVDDTDNH